MLHVNGSWRQKTPDAITEASRCAPDKLFGVAEGGLGTQVMRAHQRPVWGLLLFHRGTSLHQSQLLAQ